MEIKESAELSKLSLGAVQIPVPVFACDPSLTMVSGVLTETNIIYLYLI
jgi:hypothetical protein